MYEELSAPELDDRIAVVLDNLRELIEQGAALSGNGEDDHTSDRIAQQSAELEKLLTRRETMGRH